MTRKSLSKVVHVHVRFRVVVRHLHVVHALRPQMRGHELLRPTREVVAHVLTLPFVRQVDVVGGSREANREDDEAGDYEIRPRRSRRSRVDLPIRVRTIVDVGARDGPRRVLRLRRLTLARLLGRASPLARILRRSNRIRVRLGKQSGDGLVHVHEARAGVGVGVPPPGPGGAWVPRAVVHGVARAGVLRGVARLHDAKRGLGEGARAAFARAHAQERRHLLGHVHVARVAAHGRRRCVTTRVTRVRWR
mmetsp:Transcript_15071/g.58949  ORF Transcript_15071/g.58949 Transcript_15071/m.58949 type:complete len:249 (-) Transcript_15071:8-754(-)